MEKINILLTVDTEAHKGNNPVAEWIYGEYQSKEYGINKIMDICDALKIKAVFFLDIAEAWSWGDRIIREIGENILNRWHDLQMHIHPDHFTKDKRLFLYEYSYAEQKRIISVCLDKFIQLFKYKPVAFRAGKYGANYDTLDILSNLGVKEDFSMFYNQKWCDLNNPPLTVNSPKKYKDIIEIPVTVFKSFDIFGIKRFDAISIDDVPFFEFKKIFEEIMKKGEPKVITLMLHSFSFIKRDKNGDLKGVNRGAIGRVEEMLNFLTQQETLSFVTAKEVWEIFNKKDLSVFKKVEFIPSIKNKFFQYMFTLKRANGIFGTNKKATIFILLNTIGLIVFLFLFIRFIKYIF